MVNRDYSLDIRVKGQKKTAKIGSKLKPEIVSELIHKRKSLIDFTANIVNIKSNLIMKFNEMSFGFFGAVYFFNKTENSNNRNFIDLLNQIKTYYKSHKPESINRID